MRPTDRRYPNNTGVQNKCVHIPHRTLLYPDPIAAQSPPNHQPINSGINLRHYDCIISVGSTIGLQSMVLMLKPAARSLYIEGCPTLMVNFHHFSPTTAPHFGITRVLISINDFASKNDKKSNFEKSLSFLYDIFALEK